MATTVVATELKEAQWDHEFFAEYVRDSWLNDYMGMSENDPIQVKNDLTLKAGLSLTIPLVGKLTQAGTTGDNLLRGNEEALPNWGDTITIDQLRHAVLVGKMEESATGVDIREAAKTMLKIFFMDALRSLILARARSPHLDGVTTYANATEAEKDAWVAANSDRIVFGAVLSNNSSNDHSASLLNIDNTADKFTATLLSLSKSRLKKASPGIRPIMTKKGREWFVALSGSYGYRDFKASLSTIQQAANVRGEDNPLYSDEDLVWDGNIIREVPELEDIGLVGAGAIGVGVTIHLGAQAIGLGWGQKSKVYIDKTIDYGNQWGVSMSEVRGAKKLMYANVQHGMGTIYHSAVADA
jgi:hypothetical protein